MPTTFANVDDYFASFPSETQRALNEVRDAIKIAMPDADEGISYGMAAFRLHDRNVLFVGGWKHHIGIYPAPQGDDDFQRELARYKAEKDTVKLKLKDPIPADFVTRLANFSKVEHS